MAEPCGRATVVATDSSGVSLHVDFASLRSPQLRFVADRCDVEVTDESLILVFYTYLTPVNPNVQHVFVVRMNRGMAEAYYQSFEPSFRATLATMPGSTPPLDPVGVSDALFDTAFVDYGSVRTTPAYTRLWFYELSGGGSETEIDLYGVVAVDTVPSVLKSMISQLDAKLQPIG